MRSDFSFFKHDVVTTMMVFIRERLSVAPGSVVSENGHSKTLASMYVCMVITYSKVWVNRVRLPILLVVS